MNYQVHLTLKSSNAKTGPIPVSTTSANTCPKTCPLKGAGCYAELGPLGLHWDKVSEGARGTGWDEFCQKIEALPTGQLWRHNQAGDLPGNGSRIGARDLKKLVRANSGKRGFTYTHYRPEIHRNAEMIRHANENGFRINLSANHLDHADELAELGIASVVTVVSEAHPKLSFTRSGRRVVVCPATYKENVSCESCQLCARERETIVAFPVHGTRKRAAAKIIPVHLVDATT